MRITKNEAVCVYQGGRPEELHWGFVQFPWLYNTADGNILIAIHCEDDAPFAIDGGKSYLKSTDKGKSWVAATADDVAKMGYATADGDMLMPRAFPPKSVKGMKRPTRFGNYRIPTDDILPQKSTRADTLPFPAAISTNVFGSFDYLYYVDTLPDDICPKGLLFTRLKKGEDRPTEYEARVDWKNRLVRIYDPNVIYKSSWEGEDEELIVSSPGLYSSPRIKLGPDGKTLWTAEYKEGSDPETAAYTGKGGAYILKSTVAARCDSRNIAARAFAARKVYYEIFESTTLYRAEYALRRA